MRFLLIPVVVVASVASSVNGVGEPAVEQRPLVILVHGRGQLGLDSAATRREWKRDLDSALALVGMPRLRDEDVRLAWYADVLDPSATQTCDASHRVSSSDEMGFGSFARVFLSSLTSTMSDSVSTLDARGLFGDILFFLDSDTRCAAEQRLGSTLRVAAKERRPVIVVAYSLGSVVTYGYLSRAGAAELPDDLRLITVGSPLGVREIRELILSDADMLPTPQGIESWDNIYDPDDVFAAPLAGKVSFKELRDIPTELPSAEGAHQIARYLQDRAIGGAVGRALCATQKKAFSGRCGKF